MTLLAVKGVTKRFGGVTALNAVDLEVAAGTVHGIMGANGAGKTTLFSIIAGNLRADSGEILFDGASIAGLRPHLVCRRGIARTFQIVRPFAGLSVRENVEAGILFGRADPPPLAEAAALARDILAETGLSEQAEKPAAALTLSGRKKLEVARALGTAPKLLMLDEVMAGLNPTEVAEMIAAIRHIKARFGLTILIIEHVVSALSELSDRVLVLHHGERITEGTPAEISNDPRVLEIYFGSDDETELVL